MQETMTTGYPRGFGPSAGSIPAFACPYTVLGDWAYPYIFIGVLLTRPRHLGKCDDGAALSPCVRSLDRLIARKSYSVTSYQAYGDVYAFDMPVAGGIWRCGKSPVAS